MSEPLAPPIDDAAPANAATGRAALAPGLVTPDLVTFGCRLNAYESEVMRGAAAGLADTVLVNTCAVTAEAVRQARQSIRKIRRERPTARIVVTGCAAQIEPATFAAMPEVDFVIGNAEKLDVATYRRMAAGTDGPASAVVEPLSRIAVGDIMALGSSSPARLKRFPVDLNRDGTPSPLVGRPLGSPFAGEGWGGGDSRTYVGIPPTLALPTSGRGLGQDDQTQVETALAAPAVHIANSDRTVLSQTAGHLIAGFGGRARAYVQIQNGCDHRCTFCIIPYGRGPSRSVPTADVVRQVRMLVDAGHAEIVLTGVDMTAWGRDLGDGMQLGQLVRQVLREVPDLPRLRLSSIDSIEADAALLETIAGEPRLMPHLHLSLQAGDDMTLKRMKRRHLRADSIAFCRDVRRLRPDIAFGADLIAGFPTETDQMFDNTLRLIDDCGLTFLHVFPYSPRAGTPAARMPEVPRPLVKERAERLRAKGREALAGHLQSYIGSKVELLMEKQGLGRTPQFTEMQLDQRLSKDVAIAPGSLVRAEVAGHDGMRLTGGVVA